MHNARTYEQHRIDHRIAPHMSHIGKCFAAGRKQCLQWSFRYLITASANGKPLSQDPQQAVGGGSHSNQFTENAMHYRNGREAKNGDKVVKLSTNGGKIESFGVLHSATPGNDYCNGNIAVVQLANDYACMVDCLHIDDVAALLAEKNLDKRPEGK